MTITLLSNNCCSLSTQHNRLKIIYQVLKISTWYKYKSIINYSYVNDSLLQPMQYLTSQPVLQFTEIMIFSDCCCVVLQTF